MAPRRDTIQAMTRALLDRWIVYTSNRPRLFWLYNGLENLRTRLK